MRKFFVGWLTIRGPYYRWFPKLEPIGFTESPVSFSTKVRLDPPCRLCEVGPLERPHFVSNLDNHLYAIYADNCAEACHYQEGSRTLQALVEKSPEYLAGWLRLATLLIEIGQLQQALCTLKDFTTIHPTTIQDCGCSINYTKNIQTLTAAGLQLYPRRMNLLPLTGIKAYRLPRKRILKHLNPFHIEQMLIGFSETTKRGNPLKDRIKVLSTNFIFLIG